MKVAAATLLVAVCPVAVVWWLRASGTVSSAAVGVIIGMALSMGISHLGCLVWEKRSGSEDLLFSELMIWGYLHRRHTQRRLASALAMVGPMTEAHGRALEGLSSKELARRLERLVAGIETRDPYLHGHSRRVARYSWMIAKRMGLSRQEVARIRAAAAIHDVGKINTPKAILHKAGPLTDLEYRVIKRHPGDGAEMAEVLGDPTLTSMVRHHHERLDGTGYPDALAGEAIPLGAHIIAVADTFDAITSARPYRAARPHKQAIDILREESGTKLDPAVVRAFCGHYAGRGPIALWSSLAGLPEQALSWLGGSVASVAAAAKVVAVAALVVGAAVASSTLGVPGVTQHPPDKLSQSSTASHVQPLSSTAARTSLIRSAAATSTPRHSIRVKHAAGKPSLRHLAHAGPAPSAQPSQPSTTGGGLSSTSGPSSSGPVSGGKNEEAHTKHEGPTGGKPEEAPSKGKGEEAPSKGKGEEASGKSGEAPGRSEEPRGEPTEPAGKNEEAHGGKAAVAGGANTAGEPGATAAKGASAH